MCCFALFDHACFFLPSHLSLKHVNTVVTMCMCSIHQAKYVSLFLTCKQLLLLVDLICVVTAFCGTVLVCYCLLYGLYVIVCCMASALFCSVLYYRKSVTVYEIWSRRLGESSPPWRLSTTVAMTMVGRWAEPVLPQVYGFCSSPFHPPSPLPLCPPLSLSLPPSPCSPLHSTCSVCKDTESVCSPQTKIRSIARAGCHGDVLQVYNSAVYMIVHVPRNEQYGC